MNKEIMNKKIYKNWYFNEKRDLREFIQWEIFKDTGSKRHSTDFILVGGKHDLIHRFYTIGTFRYMVGQIKERFVNCELEPSYHYFRSVAKLRFVENDKPVNLKENFKNQIFGFDIIFDMDNKDFKKWWLKTDDLNSPDILKKVNENLTIVKNETSIIKKLLDKYKVPYVLNFSGSGFRICIEWNDISDYFNVNDFGETSTNFINWVKDECKHEFECFGEVGSGYCLTRGLFTLHPVTKLVALPLTDAQFENFTIDMANPHHLLETLEIKPTNKPYNHKREGSFGNIFEEFKKHNILGKT